MMKKCKILGTAAAMMLVFALAGCENNTDDVDALKKRVDQMEQELADMEINNNLAESSQDKASINEVSASDDSIASLTQAVDDMVSKANEAKPDGTEEEKMEQFFTLKKRDEEYGQPSGCLRGLSGIPVPPGKTFPGRIPKPGSGAGRTGR